MKSCLYLKYKPNNLKNFYGQKDIKIQLKYFISNNCLPKNIIFFGPKGTGKTSLSKIIFSLINDHKNDYDNYIEIDAASNRKISDFSIVLKNINMLSKNKVVFSIDEAHMLSNFSFCFLLKKLESFNRNTFFFFLTTNLKKIPSSIRSRCFLFNFKKFSISEIFNYLLSIVIMEKIKISKKSLFVISKNSEGSLRDALVLLEQSFYLSPYKKIRSNIVYKIVNDIKDSYCFNLLFFLIKKKKSKLNKLIYFFIKKKFDFYLIIIKLFEFLNKILFSKFNLKYIKYFYYESFNLKYIKFFIGNNKYFRSIFLIRNLIKNEISVLNFFDNKLNMFSYLIYVVMSKLNYS